ncbi:MAG: hypothetical protein V2J02_19940, partial [Pseudomonadales bacterium]|nr:hypothetical protein [Pseudomonadales bacterium]
MQLHKPLILLAATAMFLGASWAIYDWGSDQPSTENQGLHADKTYLDTDPKPRDTKPGRIEVSVLEDSDIESSSTQTVPENEQVSAFYGASAPVPLDDPAIIHIDRMIGMATDQDGEYRFMDRTALDSKSFQQKYNPDNKKLTLAQQQELQQIAAEFDGRVMEANRAHYIEQHMSMRDLLLLGKYVEFDVSNPPKG